MSVILLFANMPNRLAIVQSYYVCFRLQICQIDWPLRSQVMLLHTNMPNTLPIELSGDICCRLQICQIHWPLSCQVIYAAVCKYVKYIGH